MTGNEENYPWGRTLVVALVIFTASSCGWDSTDPATMTASVTSPTGEVSQYVSEGAGGFSFDYPGDWTQVESPPDLGPASDRVDGLVAAPPEGDFRVNLLVGVAPLPPSIDNEAFAAGAIRGTSSIAGFEEVDRGTVSVDGETAVWMDYTTLLRAQTVLQRQVYISRDEYGVVITYSATKDTIEQLAGVPEMVESSFSFD